MGKYVFDPDVLHQCALKGLGKKKPEMFDVVAAAMEKAYPGHIDNTQPWVYSIAGGAMIQMKVLFSSIFEYIIIWGTPIGSEGHSGRHAVGFWDTVLEGETWYYAEGQFERRIYRPGDRIYVGPGQARGMNFINGLWAMEYARGPIPLSIPFGLADIMISTLDFSTAAQTLGIYMDLVGRHWTNPKAEVKSWLKPFKRLAGRIPRFLGPRITRWTSPKPPYDDIPDNQGRLRTAKELKPKKPPKVTRTTGGSPRRPAKRPTA